MELEKRFLHLCDKITKLVRGNLESNHQQLDKNH